MLKLARHRVIDCTRNGVALPSSTRNRRKCWRVDNTLLAACDARGVTCGLQPDSHSLRTKPHLSAVACFSQTRFERSSRRWDWYSRYPRVILPEFCVRAGSEEAHWAQRSSKSRPRGVRSVATKAACLFGLTRVYEFPLTPRAAVNLRIGRVAETPQGAGPSDRRLSAGAVITAAISNSLVQVGAARELSHRAISRHFTVKSRQWPCAIEKGVLL